VLATTRYTNCGTKANHFADASGPITTTFAYDQWGNGWVTTDPDANAGIAGHTTTCTINNGTNPSVTVPSSTCTAYDTTFRVLPTSTTNALNQTASTGYTQTAAGGFGLWPTSSTDVNGQTTTVTYDGLGRMTSQTLPGETSGQTTTSRTYTYFCGANMPQSPCLEVDTTQRLDSATTITTRAFYDGLGRLVETRSPGPNGQDVVQYRYYDTAGRDVFESIQYFVTAYTGAPGAAAYSIPDSTQPGITTSYPSLLSTAVTDTLSHVSTSNSSVVCHPSGLTDTACYVQVATVDPLGHQQTTLTDALGRETYDRRYSGNSQSTYQVYATTQYTYDYTGYLVQILQPDGSTKTTFQYDMAGRMTGLTDPDLGTESAVFDADGNPTQVTDARGSVGTIYAGYDGLNRQLWRNTTNSSDGAYVTYSYDSTANGNMGVGRLTGETFTGGPNQSLSGSYSNVYDARGQEIQSTLTIGSTHYQTGASYDDAGDLLSLTYPDGDVLTTSYTPQGWLSGLTLQQGSTQTTLLSNLTYTGPSGAAGLASSASLNGGTYTETNSYDLLLRLTDTKLTRSSDQATLFEEALSYDSASRPTAITTTLPQGTDMQAFCYDEQDRLTWAGSVGTPPCTGTPITPGSLTSAEYTQSFAYDTLGRLTSGPLGTYSYGDSHHIHAATSIGSTYTASYDAAGNMTCRAPTSATTCAGSQPTGAQLSYDNEGRLIAWQNVPSSPTSTAAYLYDGEGNRVEQQTTQGGTTTTTIYVGGLEEITATGTTTTTTTYYGGLALAVNGVLSYLVADGVGSLTEAVDTNGNVEASQLYAPYGGVRYSSGTMPTSYGFTGQRQDALTGLDYFNARYYDPQAGQFISADTVLPGGGYESWGLSRYAYVEGNPESFTDPTGHWEIGDGEGGEGGPFEGDNPESFGGGGGYGGEEGYEAPPPPVELGGLDFVDTNSIPNYSTEIETEADGGTVAYTNHGGYIEIDFNNAEGQIEEVVVENPDGSSNVELPDGTIEQFGPEEPSTEQDAIEPAKPSEPENNNNDDNNTGGGGGNNNQNSGGKNFDPNDPEYVQQQLQNARNLNRGTGRGATTIAVDGEGNQIGVYNSGSAVQDPQFGNVQCAEGFCMIDMRDTPGKMPPSGSQIYFYTYQKNGSPPCPEFCQGDMQLFTTQNGIKIRAWYGINKSGAINPGYQDFPKP